MQFQFFHPRGLVNRGDGIELLLREWQAKMVEMVPSYGQKLNNDPALANKIRHYSSNILGLKAITLDVPAAN